MDRDKTFFIFPRGGTEPTCAGDGTMQRTGGAGEMWGMQKDGRGEQWGPGIRRQ